MALSLTFPIQCALSPAVLRCPCSVFFPVLAGQKTSPAVVARCLAVGNKVKVF